LTVFFKQERFRGFHGWRVKSSFSFQTLRRERCKNPQRLWIGSELAMRYKYHAD
jgi:hypothetical protein